MEALRAAAVALVQRDCAGDGDVQGLGVLGRGYGHHFVTLRDDLGRQTLAFGAQDERHRHGLRKREL
jgi:hypothetical protein